MASSDLQLPLRLLKEQVLLPYLEKFGGALGPSAIPKWRFFSVKWFTYIIESGIQKLFAKYITFVCHKTLQFFMKRDIMLDLCFKHYALSKWANWFNVFDLLLELKELKMWKAFAICLISSSTANLAHIFKFNPSPQLPGAGRVRAWHHTYRIVASSNARYTAFYNQIWIFIYSCRLSMQFLSENM